MNVVGKVSSFITQGMYSVATPFHPFGGAVDIVVVKQHDGTFRSTPWYIRFGKFQGVLKGAEKVVRIEVNGVDANFHMYLDNSGEAYFVREVDPDKDENEGFKNSDELEGRREDNGADHIISDDNVRESKFRRPDTDDYNDGKVDVRDERVTLGMDRLERSDSDSGRIFYEFQDEQSSLEDSVEFSDFSSARFDNLGSVEHLLESQNSNSEVVLVSVDGHILTAPISLSERNAENVQLSTPQFHLGPGEETDEYNGDEWRADYLNDVDASTKKDAYVNLTNVSNETVPSIQNSEPCEVDKGNPYQTHETQDTAHQGRELCVDVSLKNDSDSFKRVAVFKSCLELPGLAMQPTGDELENHDHPLEINRAAKDPLNKCSQCPLANEETEGNHDIPRNVNGLSQHNFAFSGSASVPDSMVEAASCEKHTPDTYYEGSESIPTSAANDDQDSQKQIEVNPDVIKNISAGETIVSEDECHENELYERHSGASIDDCHENERDEPHSGDSIDDCHENERDEPHSGAPVGGLEISLCGNLLHAGMGLSAAEDAFHANSISLEEFKLSASSIVKNENLIVKVQGKYLPWDKASHIILGMTAFDLVLPVEAHDAIPVELEASEAKEDNSDVISTPSRRWRLWPIPFRRVKTLEHTASNSSSEDVFVDSGPVDEGQSRESTPTSHVGLESPRKQIIRTNVPTTDQIASLNLKEGQNMVNFIFSTRVLGSQKVEAHIYLWKWNTRIVISDVDGTITRSDVLGQFMPLVGKDWTHSGIARLFSAIKENGYQLLFLSARAIVQAYLTKSFLFNLKQDGKSLPSGPVVISPDGLFPSLYREVVRRAPHEFKIACLEDIKALFPSDYNPFYAGFGNRDTDELSYRKIGIPKGKIFIINPKGEVAINHRIDVKSYTSLHTLVNDMFPPTSLVEQEDYNSWNYWKMPLPEIDVL